jgi:hypothetical protein
MTAISICWFMLYVMFFTFTQTVPKICQDGIKKI